MWLFNFVFLVPQTFDIILIISMMVTMIMFYYYIQRENTLYVLKLTVECKEQHVNQRVFNGRSFFESRCQITDNVFCFQHCIILM